MQKLKISKVCLTRFFMTISTAFLVACVSTKPAIPLSKTNDPNIAVQKKHFINVVAVKHGIQPSEAQVALNQAVFLPAIIDAMNKPAEKKTWGQYRHIMVTPQKITQGKLFMKENSRAIKREEKKYHVPGNIITAIIGVETAYGKYAGQYRVLDALSTLSFGYPSRAKFFQNELANYLVIVKKNNWKVTDLKGSYAGAFGLSQFMPTAYLEYAVDANGNETKVDLVHNKADVIMSTGNYLAKNGWQPGGLIAVPVQIAPNTCQRLTCNHRKPLYTVETWLKHGMVSNRVLPKHDLASLVLLTNDKGQEAWLIFHNFYVITRYNVSINYAMAVYQLSEQIQRE